MLNNHLDPRVLKHEGLGFSFLVEELRHEGSEPSASGAKVGTADGCGTDRP